MKITKSQLITEGYQQFLGENDLLDENSQIKEGKAGAVEVAIILAEIVGPEGREKLADILVAFPEFIQGLICPLSEKIFGPGPVTKLVAKVCRFGLKAQFSIFYVGAYLLRKMDDEQVQQLIAGSEQPAAAEETPALAEVLVDMSEGRLPNKLEESVVSRWQVLSGVNKEVK
jgi:hypothetical protein